MLEHKAVGRFVALVALVALVGSLGSTLHLSAEESSTRSPRLVADLAQIEIPGHGVPGYALDYAISGDRVFYPAFDPDIGHEPWTSDGTPDGTRLVADICPGPCSSDPSGFAATGGKIFFFADDGVAGKEPWVTGGSSRSTLPLADTVPGPEGLGGHRSTSAVAGGHLYFLSSTDQRQELWSSDGTPRGTRRVEVLCRAEGWKTCHVYQLPVATGLQGTADRLFFVMSYDPILDPIETDLWTSDGTPEGTRPVVEDCERCFPVGAFGPRVFFFRDYALWASDGSDDGTQALTASCTPEFCPLGFSRLPSGSAGLYFVARDGGSQSSLYRTDGTPSGTTRLADGQSAIGSISYPIPAPDGVYFTASGTGLWFLATEKTVPKRVATGVHSNHPSAVLRDLLLLRTSTESADELIVVGADEPEAQTLAQYPRAPIPASYPRTHAGILDLISVADHAVFRAHDPEAGWELWATDGTEAGTHRLADLGTNRSSMPGPTAALGEHVVFDVARADLDDGVWRSDGSAAGTMPYVDGPPSAFEFFASHDSLLASTVRHWGDGSGLWRLGRSAVQLYGPMGQARGFIDLGEQTLFGSMATGGVELWATDAEGSTAIVRDISPGMQPSVIIPSTPNSSSPRELTVLGSAVVFSAGDADFGENRELWRSDGTFHGTERMADICPGECQSDPSDFLRLGDHVYFAADDGEAGRELWRTDGTAGGTQLALDLRPGPVGSNPQALFTLGNASDEVLFFARFSAGLALWSFDTGRSEAERIRDLTLDSSDLGEASGWRRSKTRRILELRIVGERAYFVAVNDATGPELWTTDGSTEGTLLLDDLWPGPRGSYPESLTAVDDRLVFAATSPDVGRELWTITSEGAIQLFVDVASGADSSNPAHLAAAGNRLFFAAGRKDVGRELWTVPLSSGEIFSDGFEIGLEPWSRYIGQDH